MKLNLGSGDYPLDGWTNVDQHRPADVNGDIRELDFTDVEEIRMDHLLEHLPWTETHHVLARVYGWMRPGATLTIEVPDMKRIMRDAPKMDALGWLTYVYGNQDHPGEFHMAGFTEDSLRATLQSAGFSRVQTRTFLSELGQRRGMPCLEAKAVA